MNKLGKYDLSFLIVGERKKAERLKMKMNSVMFSGDQYQCELSTVLSRQIEKYRCMYICGFICIYIS